MATNVTAVFQLCRAAIPAMVGAGLGARGGGGLDRGPRRLPLLVGLLRQQARGGRPRARARRRDRAQRRDHQRGVPGLRRHRHGGPRGREHRPQDPGHRPRPRARARAHVAAEPADHARRGGPRGAGAAARRGPGHPRTGHRRSTEERTVAEPIQGRTSRLAAPPGLQPTACSRRARGSASCSSRGRSAGSTGASPPTISPSSSASPSTTCSRWCGPPAATRPRSPA